MMGGQDALAPIRFATDSMNEGTDSSSLARKGASHEKGFDFRRANRLGVSLSLARPALADETNEKISDARANLEQLQQEQFKAFEIVVEKSTLQYMRGAGSYIDLSTLLMAHKEFISAILESTYKPEEQIALLKKQLKVAQDILDFVKKSREAGLKTSEIEDYEANAHYLSIKIKLFKLAKTGHPAELRDCGRSGSKLARRLSQLRRSVRDSAGTASGLTGFLVAKKSLSRPNRMWPKSPKSESPCLKNN